MDVFVDKLHHDVAIRYNFITYYGWIVGKHCKNMVILLLNSVEIGVTPTLLAIKDLQNNEYEYTGTGYVSYRTNTKLHVKIRDSVYEVKFITFSYKSHGMWGTFIETYNITPKNPQDKCVIL